MFGRIFAAVLLVALVVTRQMKATSGLRCGAFSVPESRNASMAEWDGAPKPPVSIESGL